jgi:hypothetical protein
VAAGDGERLPNATGEVLRADVRERGGDGATVLGRELRESMRVTADVDVLEAGLRFLDDDVPGQAGGDIADGAAGPRRDLLGGFGEFAVSQDDGSIHGRSLSFGRFPMGAAARLVDRCGRRSVLGRLVVGREAGEGVEEARKLGRKKGDLGVVQDEDLASANQDDSGRVISPAGVRN